MNVSIVRPADRELESVKPESPVQLRVVADGLEGEPYVHLTEVPAGHHIATHSHSETEVTIILSGSAKVDGGDECPAGTVIVIPANQNYALDAGDEPLTFVVVRPRKASYDGPK
ncbi:MAG: Cupin domain [Actinomycetia bacterium]|nr:Cupin domain [Actinomycetes bacterium]